MTTFSPVSLLGATNFKLLVINVHRKVKTKAFKDEFGRCKRFNGKSTAYFFADVSYSEATYNDSLGECQSATLKTSSNGLIFDSIVAFLSHALISFREDDWSMNDRKYRPSRAYRAVSRRLRISSPLPPPPLSSVMMQFVTREARHRFDALGGASACPVI